MKRTQMVVVAAILLFAALLIPDTVAIARAPAVPRQESPANGQTDLPTIATVRWVNSVAGERYRVQVAANAGMTALLVDATVTNATGYTLLSLSKNTTYYWRVNASKGGATSAWSPIWSFTTTNATTPAAPILSSPANNATNVSASPTFEWQAAAGATSYDLQVAEFASFVATVFEQTLLPGTSYQVNYLPQFSEIGSLTFYWRVRGRNASGTGPWSAVRAFTIDPDHVPPPFPALPASGVTNQPTTLTLQWSPPPTTGWEQSSYVLQVSTTYAFGSILIEQQVDQQGTGNGAYTVSGLSNNTTYYWRVSATIPGRSSGGWSTVSSFSTGP